MRVNIEKIVLERLRGEEGGVTKWDKGWEEK